MTASTTTVPNRRYARRWPGGAGLWRFGTITVALLLTLPILVVLIGSLAPTGDIWSHLAATVLPSYVANTIWILLGVGLGVLLGGVGTAWLVSLCDFPFRRIFEWALLLPLAVPAYVIAYTYTGLLDYAGPAQSMLREWFGWTAKGDYWFPEVRSLGGAIVMLVLVLYPYVYLLSRAAFVEQSVCSLEVSRTLGCGPWAAMWRVALPLARPSIAAGTALALMEALSDFGTVQYFGVDTFTTGIYRTWLNMNRPDAALQLAALLMLFVFALLWIERRSRGRAAFHHMSTRYRALPSFKLRGWRAAAAMIFCALPLLFGFLLPAAALVAWTLETAAQTIDTRFVRLVVNSVTLAAAASVLTLFVALLLGYGMRMGGGRLERVCARVAGLGYATPGAVIAVGVVLPFAWFDNALDGLLREYFGVSSGLILSGGIATLLFAYTVRFLAIALGAVESGLSRITPHMDDAARGLGATPMATLARVHAPIIKGSLLSACLLVFVDVMKELPATLLIRPFNFDTLAIRTYEYAGDEQLREAGASALAIVAAGILPVILLSRAVARARPGAEPRREVVA
ncbi:MAG: ABC transporter permease [Alphaproteobacteria bacterium]